MRRVHQAPLFIDAHVFQQPAHRAALVGGQALVDFALLFRDVQVNGSTGFPARVGNRQQRRGADGAQTVCADADAEFFRLPARRLLVMFEKLFERQREQFLRPLGLGRMKAGSLVKHGDVSEANTRLRRGIRKRFEHVHTG